MASLMNERKTLKRNVTAVKVPDGTPIDLPMGSEVTITQSLGGDYTVFTDYGFMARINGPDADALGLEVSKAAQSGGPLSEKAVWDALRLCYDPEIPVNIVDLGLVYEMRLEPADGGGKRVFIRLTLTAPGCGMGDVLKRDVETKVGRLADVKEVDVELTFEPAWDQSMMTEAARLELGLM